MNSKKVKQTLKLETVKYRELQWEKDWESRMTQIFDIGFKPFNIKTKVKRGTSIFNAAKMQNIALRSDCGEKGTCGKCAVIIDNPENLSPATRTEKKSAFIVSIKILLQTGMPG